MWVRGVRPFERVDFYKQPAIDVHPRSVPCTQC
jgi:hypothetical protein